jgi:protein-tyrosine-phosphatase
MMPKLLFVCTANICRSPMAVGLFSKILKDKNTYGKWIIESAGTWALEGQPAAAGSQAVMKDKGLDISGHIARSVNQEIIQSSDLIITMESGQKESLCMEFSEYADRIYLLSEMTDQKQDIEDPYGGVFSEYELAASEIEEFLLKGFDTIIHKALHSNRT